MVDEQHAAFAAALDELHEILDAHPDDTTWATYVQTCRALATRGGTRGAEKFLGAFDSVPSLAELEVPGQQDEFERVLGRCYNAAAALREGGE